MGVNFLRKNRRYGFSLLALLLVLGTVSALIFGAFIVYPKVHVAQHAEAESNNIVTIQAGIKSRYAAPAAECSKIISAVAGNL